jgi:hypothetical protein
MTQTLNEPSKRSKNRDVKFWKIRLQKQISSWRKELSIIAETGTGSDNGNDDGGGGDDDDMIMMI